MPHRDGGFQAVSSPFLLQWRDLPCPVPLKAWWRALRTTISPWLRENAQDPGAARCGSATAARLPAKREDLHKKHPSRVRAEAFHGKDSLRIYIFLLTNFRIMLGNGSVHGWEEMPIVSYISVLLPLTANASQGSRDVPGRERLLVCTCA